MRMSEVNYSGSLPVDGYGPGFFRVAGQVHHGAIVVLPGGVSGWGGYDDLAALRAAAAEIDLVLVGSGSEIAPLPRAFSQALEAAGLGAEVMATPAACRTYNVLLGEGRRVGLALLPV